MIVYTVCGWCKGPMVSSHEIDMNDKSHGICPACVVNFFGVKGVSNEEANRVSVIVAPAGK
jgi:hypothetical protein